MMEPLNKKERKKAFWNFLAFFLVTILFIIGAVFVNFEVPEQQDELLQAKFSLLSNEIEFQTEFTKGIKEVAATLDSINQPNQRAMYLEQVVSTKLAGVQESVSQADSLRQRSLYNYVIQAMLDLQQAKRKLRNLQEAQKLIGEYQKRLKATKKELNQVRQNLSTCRQLSTMR